MISIIRKDVRVTGYMMMLLLMAMMVVFLSAPCVADSNVVSVCQGDHISLVLKDDGTVWYWGHNPGLHGDGTEDRCLPAKVPIEGVQKISVGRLDCMALKTDGTVWTWGSNYYGSRGDGTQTPKPKDTLPDDYHSYPARVPGLSDIVDIECTPNNYFAIGKDGTVWAWGENLCGSLGDGTKEDRLTPVQVKGLTGIVSVKGSGIHTLALDDQGRVWAWGSNSYGSLGDGTTNDSYTPKQVPIDHVKAVFAGIRTSWAVKDDGSLWAWGHNEFGQLGDGTTENRYSPVRIGLDNVVDMAPDGVKILALRSDGTVWGWGYDTVGFKVRNGDGTIDTSPEKMDLSDIKAITSYYTNFLVLKNDGTLWVWGGNERGALGIGIPDSSYTGNTRPVYVERPTEVIIDPDATPVPTTGTDYIVSVGPRTSPASPCVTALASSASSPRDGNPSESGGPTFTPIFGVLGIVIVVMIAYLFYKKK